MLKSMETESCRFQWLDSGNSRTGHYAADFREDSVPPSGGIKGLLRNSSRIHGVEQKWTECAFSLTKSDKTIADVPDSFSRNL